MDSTATATLPAPPQDLVDDSAETAAPLVDEEMLVEDVSIDGMCGVY